MNRILLGALLAGMAVAGCRSATGPPPVGEDRAAQRAEDPTPAPSSPQGTGCDDLVVIEAPDTDTGIDAEDTWIRRHYPGHRKVRQSLVSCDETMVDLIEIEGPNGERREVFFDISSFFGRW
jgi:hypothetical protein